MELVTYQQEKNQVVVSSIDIATNFGKEHRNVCQSIRNLVAENSAAKSMFYETTYENRGKQYPMFLMNRDGFSLLVMGFTGKDALDWKVKYIGAFNAMESKLNSPEFIIQRAMGLLQQRCDALLLENKELEKKVEEDKPKVLFADSVAASKSSILIGELAKLISQNGRKIGQNRLFQWMRANGYLMKQGSSYNMPTQKSLELGIIEIKEGSRIDANGVTVVTKTPKVTGKGQQYFLNKFLGENNED